MLNENHTKRFIRTNNRYLDDADNGRLLIGGATMIALPQPRWMYTRSKQLNSVRDCRECDGTGTTAVIDPQYERPCPVCNGEMVMDSVLFHDPLNYMHQYRNRSSYAHKYKYARARAMRKVNLPKECVL